MSHLHVAQQSLLHQYDPEDRHCYPVSVQDDSWKTLDPQLMNQGQVNVYDYRTQNIHPCFENQEAYQHLQDWYLYNHQQYSRYLSPSATDSSTPSGDSPTAEYSLSWPNPTPSIRSHTPLAFQHPYTNSIQDGSAIPNSPTWHHLDQGAGVSFESQVTVASFIVPSQSTLHNEEYDIDQQSELVDDSKHGDNILKLHGASPVHMLQPEELELSEINTVSTAKSQHDRKPFQARKTPKEQQYDDDEEDSDNDIAMVDHDSDSDFTAATPKRRRPSRASGTRKLSSPTHQRRMSNQPVVDKQARVHKRNSSNASTTTGHKRRPSKTKPKPKGPNFNRALSSNSVPIAKGDRVFPCIFHQFGCDQEFPNKNEWKRHVACQHLQLGFYRCDLDKCDPEFTGSAGYSLPLSPPASNEDEFVVVYNDFNRKDLFTQHCRRMHGPSRNPALCSSPRYKKDGETLNPTKEDEAAFERQLDIIRQRCWQVRRTAPARSNCPYCDQVFDAAYYNLNTLSIPSRHNVTVQGPEEKAWEERMEHLGRHYEKDGCDKAREERDEDLEQWGLSTGVFHRLEDGRVWLLSAKDPTEDPTPENGEEGNGRKARRQPSRTVVVKKRSANGEGVNDDQKGDEDVDAEAEDE